MSDASLLAPELLYDELFDSNSDIDEVLAEIEDLLTTTRAVLERNAGHDIDDAAVAEEEVGGGSRGAPPAAVSAVEALETFEVGSSETTVMVCAVCKDPMVMGEVGKKLPCEHCYHGDCILPWLRTRNSCPLCRFQLQTDDPEYESKN